MQPGCQNLAFRGRRRGPTVSRCLTFGFCRFPICSLLSLLVCLSQNGINHLVDTSAFEAWLSTLSTVCLEPVPLVPQHPIQNGRCLLGKPPTVGAQVMIMKMPTTTYISEKPTQRRMSLPSWNNDALKVQSFFLLVALTSPESVAVPTGSAWIPLMG